MKILCVSDTVSPLIYSPNIKERYRDIDLVLGAGDLPMEYLGFIASSLNKPVLFVFGNHNLKQLPLYQRSHSLPPDPFYIGLDSNNGADGSTYVDKTVQKVKGLLIGGLGGSMRYNKGKNQFTDLQMLFRIFPMIPRMLWNKLVHGRYIDILITHAAPLGIHDLDDPCHRGFGAFRWFMHVFKPQYLIHGHIHLYDQNAVRVSEYFNTKVINVYDHYQLTIEESDQRNL